MRARRRSGEASVDGLATIAACRASGAGERPALPGRLGDPRRALPDAAEAGHEAVAIEVRAVHRRRLSQASRAVRVPASTEGDHRLQVIQPRTLADAVEIRGTRPDAVVVAGGTETMVARNRGERAGPLLDLSRVDELRAVDSEGGLVRVGALVTYTRVIEELGDTLPGLAAACAHDRVAPGPQPRDARRRARRRRPLGRRPRATRAPPTPRSSWPGPAAHGACPSSAS